jgi:hypothetical protein
MIYGSPFIGDKFEAGMDEPVPPAPVGTELDPDRVKVTRVPNAHTNPLVSVINKEEGEDEDEMEIELEVEVSWV